MALACLNRNQLTVCISITSFLCNGLESNHAINFGIKELYGQDVEKKTVSIGWRRVRGEWCRLRDRIPGSPYVSVLEEWCERCDEWEACWARDKERGIWEIQKQVRSYVPRSATEYGEYGKLLTL